MAYAYQGFSQAGLARQQARRENRNEKPTLGELIAETSAAVLRCHNETARQSCTASLLMYQTLALEFGMEIKFSKVPTAAIKAAMMEAAR